MSTYSAQCVGLTDVGLERGHNEDFFDFSIDNTLAVLADGMGGHNAGEVASALCVNHIISAFDIQKPQTVEHTQEVLTQSLVDANALIFASQKSTQEYAGMGTTAVVAKLTENQLCVGHVGDSRLYQLRNETLRQITKDHSVLQELVDRGFYTEEEARHAPQRNLVTRALGTAETLEVEMQRITVKSNDIYLLCSDGLTDLISDEDIRLTINRFNDNLNAAAQSLIDSANQKGGSDNISVLLMQCLENKTSIKSFFLNIKNLWFSKK